MSDEARPGAHGRDQAHDGRLGDPLPRRLAASAGSSGGFRTKGEAKLVARRRAAQGAAGPAVSAGRRRCSSSSTRSSTSTRARRRARSWLRVLPGQGDRRVRRRADRRAERAGRLALAGEDARDDAPRRAPCAAAGARRRRCGGSGSSATSRSTSRTRSTPKPEFVPFDDWDEVEAVAAELGPFGPLAIFCVGTGVRPEEAFGADWTDVDLEAGVFTIRRAFAKGKLKTYAKTARSRRRVPIRAKVIASLEDAATAARASCSPRPRAGGSTSTTGARASGRPRSRRPASSTAASTTCATRSRRGASRPA